MSTAEYTLQVDKFNQTQRRSIEETIPDACRSLQSLYASNGNQWADILDRVVKIESSSAERGNKLLTRVNAIINFIQLTCFIYHLILFILTVVTQLTRLDSQT